MKFVAWCYLTPSPLVTYFLPNNRGKKFAHGGPNHSALAAGDAAACGHRRRCLGGVSARHHGKLGLALMTCARNPNLIYARLTAYGGNGLHRSRRNRPGGGRRGVGMTTGIPTPEGKPDHPI